jgi:hypothetical protein
LTPADVLIGLRLAAAQAASRRAIVRINADSPTFGADPRGALAELVRRAAGQVTEAHTFTFTLRTASGLAVGSVDLLGPVKRWRS